MANLYRGEVVDLQFNTDIDPATIDELEIVISQNGSIKKTWTLADVTLGEESVTVTADQATTLALATNTRAYAQMRARIEDVVRITSVNCLTVLPWLGSSEAFDMSEVTGTSTDRRVIQFAAATL